MVGQSINKKKKIKGCLKKATTTLLQILYHNLAGESDKTMKHPVMITGVPEGIRKEQLLNTNQNLFGETAILIRWTWKGLRNTLC